MPIALTYDDGPDPVWTPRLLDELRRLDARATFFVIAPRAVEHAREIEAMLEGGHEVGFHCFEHRRHTELTADEIAADTEAGLDLLASLDVHPVDWRTPWGVVTEDSRRVAEEHGLRLCGWTVDTHDWRGDDWPSMLGQIFSLGGPHDGDVILMHDGIGPGALRDGSEQTLRLTEPLVNSARRRGLATGAMAEEAA